MITNAKNAAEEFWDYSAQLYKKEDVKKHCLLLQENLGLDVNMILLLCWLAEMGFGQLDVRVLTTIFKMSDNWQREILNPLRLVRRQINGIAGQEILKVYKSLKISELVAEKAEQAVLIQTLDGKFIPKSTDSAHNHLIRNVEIYFSFLKLKPKKENLKSIKYIVDQIKL